ncbi:hypothetical protein AMS59_15735 [Lysinibacillus sp. FJAT-14745]|nr:hypothetical protein AMS59_15735 [Lysinibacillus sp. FJAT-14745]
MFRATRFCIEALPIIIRISRITKPRKNYFVDLINYFFLLLHLILLLVILLLLWIYIDMIPPIPTKQGC